VTNCHLWLTSWTIITFSQKNQAVSETWSGSLHSLANISMTILDTKGLKNY